MRFRSHLLSHYPKDNYNVSSLMLFLRWTITISIFSVAGVIIYLITFRILPKSNLIGQILYGLHDNVYLPIKGLIFTQFFPFAFIWIFAISTLFLIGIASWLSDQTLLRPIYIRWWRLLIRRQSRHATVLRRIRWFKRLSLPGYRPEIPRVIAQHEWETTRLNIWRSQRRYTKDNIIKYWLALLKLTLEIEYELPKYYFRQRFRRDKAIIPERRSQRYDVSLQRWHFTYLVLQATTDSLETDELDRLFKILPLNELAKVTGDRPCPSPLAPATIIEHLQNLLTLSSTDIKRQLSDGPSIASNDRNTLVDLVEWIESCETLFEQVIDELQRTSGVLVSFNSRAYFPKLPEQKHIQLDYSVLGQLILQMVVHVAVITNNPLYARRFLMLFQALQWTLDMTTSSDSDVNEWRRVVGYSVNPMIGEMVYPSEVFAIFGNLEADVLKKRKNERDNQIPQTHWNWEQFLKVDAYKRHIAAEMDEMR